MAKATFEGKILRVFPQKHGCTFLIQESVHWDCKGTQTFRLAAWGKLGQNLYSKLRIGHPYKFHCEIEIVVKDNKTFTNFKVTHWGEVKKPAKVRQLGTKKRNDDWFVPDIEDRDSSTARRYEGFPA